jgi:hypothetical protein
MHRFGHPFFKNTIMKCYHLPSKWSLVRPLSLGRDAGKMPALTALPVNQSAVLRYSVVPENDGACLPPDTGLEVGAVG